LRNRVEGQLSKYLRIYISTPHSRPLEEIRPETKKPGIAKRFRVLINPTLNSGWERVSHLRHCHQKLE
jgi:hypothetical protein